MMENERTRIATAVLRTLLAKTAYDDLPMESAADDAVLYADALLHRLQDGEDVCDRVIAEIIADADGPPATVPDIDSDALLADKIHDAIRAIDNLLRHRDFFAEDVRIAMYPRSGTMEVSLRTVLETVIRNLLLYV